MMKLAFAITLGMVCSVGVFAKQYCVESTTRIGSPSYFCVDSDHGGSLMPTTNFQDMVPWYSDQFVVLVRRENAPGYQAWTLASQLFTSVNDATQDLIAFGPTQPWSTAGLIYGAFPDGFPGPARPVGEAKTAGLSHPAFCLPANGPLGPPNLASQPPCENRPIPPQPPGYRYFSVMYRGVPVKAMYAYDPAEQEQIVSNPVLLGMDQSERVRSILSVAALQYHVVVPLNVAAQYEKFTNAHEIGEVYDRRTRGIFVVFGPLAGGSEAMADLSSLPSAQQIKP